MEHCQELQNEGSPLWEHLIWLIWKKDLEPLDPIPIRNIVIAKERARVLKQNIAPHNRLFDLGDQEIFAQKNLLVNQSKSRMGQQDCKDFFICLAENRNHWSDVFNLFKVNLKSFTKCSSCQNVSVQTNNTADNIFFHFECPEENTLMSSFIESKMNGSVLVQGWKDEDGCGKITDGGNSTKINKMNETNFLIFVIKRLISVEGQLQIVHTKVPVGGNILITDMSGQAQQFSPIAVIHHTGEVIENTTRGHYLADVLQGQDNKWFRTSDDEPPVEINSCDLTDRGYIFLYKKTTPEVRAIILYFQINNCKYFRKANQAEKSSKNRLLMYQTN